MDWESERRLAEGAKMGLTTAYLAERAIPKRVRDVNAVGVRTVSDVFRHLFER